MILNFHNNIKKKHQIRNTLFDVALVGQATGHKTCKRKNMNIWVTLVHSKDKSLADALHVDR
jgi:hypothetical protein